MEHVQKIKQLILDQGWAIDEVLEIAGKFHAKISKDGESKLVKLAIFSEEEKANFLGGNE
jgi:hypothetical protein